MPINFSAWEIFVGAAFLLHAALVPSIVGAGFLPGARARYG